MSLKEGLGFRAWGSQLRLLHETKPRVIGCTPAFQSLSDIKGYVLSVKVPVGGTPPLETDESLMQELCVGMGVGTGRNSKAPRY